MGHRISQKYLNIRQKTFLSIWDNLRYLKRYLTKSKISWDVGELRYFKISKISYVFRDISRDVSGMQPLRWNFSCIVSNTNFSIHRHETARFDAKISTEVAAPLQQQRRPRFTAKSLKSILIKWTSVNCFLICIAIRNRRNTSDDIQIFSEVLWTQVCHPWNFRALNVQIQVWSFTIPSGMSERSFLHLLKNACAAAIGLPSSLWVLRFHSRASDWYKTHQPRVITWVRVVAWPMTQPGLDASPEPETHRYPCDLGPGDASRTVYVDPPGNHADSDPSDDLESWT